MHSTKQSLNTPNKYTHTHRVGTDAHGTEPRPRSCGPSTHEGGREETWKP